MPPEVYRITFQVKGLYVSQTGEFWSETPPAGGKSFPWLSQARAAVPDAGRPCSIQILTKAVCALATFGRPRKAWMILIVRIGRMIAYQEYNTKSPLNGLAAKWATQHPELLPIDARNIAPADGQDSAGKCYTAAGARSVLGNESGRCRTEATRSLEPAHRRGMIRCWFLPWAHGSIRAPVTWKTNPQSTQQRVTLRINCKPFKARKASLEVDDIGSSLPRKPAGWPKTTMRADLRSKIRRIRKQNAGVLRFFYCIPIGAVASRYGYP